MKFLTRNKVHSHSEKADSPEYRRERREFATFWLLVATTIFTFITVLIFAFQLEEMRKVFEPVKKSADAAERSAEVAEQTLKLTQRAFFVITPSITDYAVGQVPINNLNAKNIGVTPAYTVTLKTYIGRLLRPLTDDLKLPEEVIGETAASTVVRDEAIGGQTPLAFPLTQEAYDGIESGKEQLIAYGILEFEDVFGCKVRRDVCFLFTGDTIRKNTPRLCSGARNVERYVGECKDRRRKIP